MGNNDFEGKIDAEGRFELYPSFWDKLKEVVSVPEVSRKLTEAIGKKKRLDWYDIRDYNLGVKRDDELITDFPRDGDCLLVLSISEDATASIKFDSPNADSFELSNYRKFRHNFSNLYLTNTKQTDDKTLRLLFGRGDWEVVRHHPEEEIMAINADTVDSIHASASREANKLLALDSEGKFPNTVFDGMQSELYANRPASPVVGDIFIARDTSQVLVCFTAGTWTDITVSTAVDISFTPTGDIVATDIQAAIEELDSEKVARALFDANTILAANADNTPLALTIAEQRLVGRITGGNIAALTAAQVRALLNVADGAIANLVEDTTPQLGGNLDAQNHSINNLLGIGATPISAAQWGYLGALTTHPLGGDGTAGRIPREIRFTIKNGGAANSLKCETLSRWNGDVIAETDDITKGALTGHFRLSANGEDLTIEKAGLSGNVLMALGFIAINGSTTDLQADVHSIGNDIFINLYTDNSTGINDITALVDTGVIYLYILYITDA